MREEEWRIEAITARQVRASRPGQRRDLGFCTPQVSGDEDVDDAW